MDAKVRIDSFIHIEVGVDVQLAGRPAPRLTGAEIETEPRVLTAGDEPLLPGAVALPMKLAARIDQPLDAKVRAVEQESDERVRIIELRVCRDDDARFLHRNRCAAHGGTRRM